MADASNYTENIIRIIDVSLASMFLVASLPFLLPILVVLSITGEREIFYLQKRVGRQGRCFDLVKFATMLKDSASMSSGEITLPNDARVLKFGRLLRATKLNEIPQLWNVVRGEMSLIGPRPQTPRYFAQCPEELKGLVCSVRPGLSGAASVVFRDEESLFAQIEDVVCFDENVVMPYKYEIEEWYVQHQSFALYIRLIFLTLVSVFIPSNTWVRRFISELPTPPIEVARWLLKC